MLLSENDPSSKSIKIFLLLSKSTTTVARMLLRRIDYVPAVVCLFVCLFWFCMFAIRMFSLAWAITKLQHRKII